MALTFSPAIVEKNASRIFWVFIALHVLCWTILPALTQPSVPLDVAEGFVWGREMQWGYHKHPPLQAWLLQFVTHITGSSGFGYFGLSAVTTAIGFWAVYRTGRLFTTKTKALIAALLCEGIVYFNFLAIEFNPNVLQIMTWALAGYAFAHAVLRHKIKYWLLLSLCITLGIYAKYSIALLVLGLGLFILLEKEVRSNFFKIPYPILLGFVALNAALLYPHVRWLFQHDFYPFTYALSRSVEAKDIWERLIFPVRFTLTQILDMLPMLGLAALFYKSKQTPDALPRLNKRLLCVLAFAPLILNFIISLFTGHKALDMWGMPYLTFIPLWIMVIAPTEISEKKLKIFALAWSFVFLLGLTAFYVNVIYATALGYKPLRAHFPGQELSRTMYELWNKETQAPLEYIISDAWVGGNIALYAPDINHRPHVFIDGNPVISRWIDEGDVLKKGALVVWVNNGARPEYLFKMDAKDITHDQTIALPWQTVTTAPRPQIHWAIIKPKKDFFIK
ncbi:MAG: hypothetical protein EB059_01885 [Alphaproteobacteria bacterium]|nr:hypothetical protein [Alphaproteobacteria bacterium]